MYTNHVYVSLHARFISYCTYSFIKATICIATVERLFMTKYTIFQQKHFGKASSWRRVYSRCCLNMHSFCRCHTFGPVSACHLALCTSNGRACWHWSKTTEHLPLGQVCFCEVDGTSIKFWIQVLSHCPKHRG